MTEARRYLQEAPREGAADLVACASVTFAPSRRAQPVSLYRPIIDRPRRQKESRAGRRRGHGGSRLARIRADRVPTTMLRPDRRRPATRQRGRRGGEQRKRRSRCAVAHEPTLWPTLWIRAKGRSSRVMTAALLAGPRAAAPERSLDFVVVVVVERTVSIHLLYRNAKEARTLSTVVASH